MKKIKLNKGFVAKVDNLDFKWLNQWQWTALKGKNTYYAVRHAKEGLIYMHRLILNTPKGVLTDHQDHNGLNCQRHNIRNCNNSQNRMNCTPHGRSKYLGVNYAGKYITAEIKTNGVKIHLGNFQTEENAARAYDEAAKLHHGEFANLNFK